MAASSPIARILPLAIATSPACGAPVESPVHTMPPRMTRSAFCPQAGKRRQSAPANRRRLIGPSTEFGDAVDRLERRDGIGARALVRRDGGRARLRGGRGGGGG